MSDEGYNVKDIIKRNIASARKDAAGLKRPRGPEGKPPEMGSNFMQKRADAAAKIKAGRKELARQTENFITRTVDMMFNRLNEATPQGVMAAAKGQARRGGGKMEVSKTPGVTTAKVERPRGPTFASAPKSGNLAMVSRVGKDGERRSRTIKAPKPQAQKEATENFISNTVEILMERIMANKAAKNAWMAKQPTDPDNEPKIPKKYKSEAEEDVQGAVQFNATSRSQYNVPKDSKTYSGAGDSGKPFDAKSKLTAARTVKKHTTNPLMSAVDAKNKRNNKAYQAKRDDASHQNFIGKTVEILAEKLIGKQSKLDVNKSGKLDAQDFKMLRSGKKKGK
jgi:hypothetical protein